MVMVELVHTAVLPGRPGSLQLGSVARNCLGAAGSVLGTFADSSDPGTGLDERGLVTSVPLELRVMELEAVELPQLLRESYWRLRLLVGS